MMKSYELAWQKANIRQSFKQTALLAVALILGTSIVDFLSMDTATATVFIAIRLGLSSIIFASMAAVSFLDKRPNRLKFDYVGPTFALDSTIIAGGFLIFIQAAESEKLKFDVSLGVITALMIIHFSLHRFKRIHLAWSLGVLIIFLSANFIFNISTWSLVASHIALTFCAFFMQQKFYRSLARKFSQLKRVTPKAVAERLVITDTEVTEDAFKPQDRYCACLISDWRDFQKLTESLSNTEIARIFEEYYDFVYDAIEKLIPSGEYFINWHADELFVIFYSESGNQLEVQTNATNFAEFLATDGFRKLNEISPKTILFDVGISAGHGLLGIMGPTDAKKTTISGHIPGRAKRLEGEAKTIRKATGYQNPIITFDNSLSVTKWAIKSWTASNKNIEQEKIKYSLVNDLPTLLKLKNQ